MLCSVAVLQTTGVCTFLVIPGKYLEIYTDNDNDNNKDNDSGSDRNNDNNNDIDIDNDTVLRTTGVCTFLVIPGKYLEIY